MLLLKNKKNKKINEEEGRSKHIERFKILSRTGPKHNSTKMI